MKILTIAVLGLLLVGCESDPTAGTRGEDVGATGGAAVQADAGTGGATMTADAGTGGAAAVADGGGTGGSRVVSGTGGARSAGGAGGGGAAGTGGSVGTGGMGTGGTPGSGGMIGSGGESGSGGAIGGAGVGGAECKPTLSAGIQSDINKCSTGSECCLGYCRGGYCSFAPREDGNICSNDQDCINNNCNVGVGGIPTCFGVHAFTLPAGSKCTGVLGEHCDLGECEAVRGGQLQCPTQSGGSCSGGSSSCVALNGCTQDPAPGVCLPCTANPSSCRFGLQCSSVGNQPAGIPIGNCF